MGNLKQFIADTLKNNGATYNLNTGEINPSEGFFVGLNGMGETVGIDKPINGVIQKFVLENSNLLSNREFFVGSWIEDDKLFLDIVVKVDDKQAAIDIGKDNKQIAIYDANKKEVITL